MIDLAGLSPARPADAAVLDPIRSVLKLLSIHVNRVLGSAEASPGASSDATASSYPASRPRATPGPMPAGGIGGGVG
jgi:hypothetical protein